jgi:hypothetical protein
MSTNHNLSPWIKFRSQLCQAIDQRRSHLSIFTSEQIYLFINRCSTLFTKPGTADAQSALDRIQDEGTFLLVARSLRDFLAMFPQADGQGDLDQASAPLSAAPPTKQGGEPAGNARRRSSYNPTVVLSPANLQLMPDTARAVPFDLSKFERLMQETSALHNFLAARPDADETQMPAPPRQPPFHGNADQSSGGTAPTVGLDEHHKMALRELLKRQCWSIADLRRLASSLGLMPWACVARLNEWATETFGDLLLEGEEVVTVNVNLKERISL